MHSTLLAVVTHYAIASSDFFKQTRKLGPEEKTLGLGSGVFGGQGVRSVTSPPRPDEAFQRWYLNFPEVRKSLAQVANDASRCMGVFVHEHST